MQRIVNSCIWVIIGALIGLIASAVGVIVAPQVTMIHYVFMGIYIVAFIIIISCEIILFMINRHEEEDNDDH